MRINTTVKAYKVHSGEVMENCHLSPKRFLFPARFIILALVPEIRIQYTLKLLGYKEWFQLLKTIYSPLIPHQNSCWQDEAFPCSYFTRHRNCHYDVGQARFTFVSLLNAEHFVVIVILLEEPMKSYNKRTRCGEYPYLPFQDTFVSIERNEDGAKYGK